MFALPLFLAMAWWAGGGATQVSRRDWMTLIGLGFIGYYVGSYLDFAGLQYISAGLGRLILYLYPTLVLILSAIFLKQPIRARHLVSLALSYGGIALAFLHEIDIGEDMGRMALGSILVFGSAVTYSVYLIIGSGLVQRLGSMRFTAYASIPASLFVIAHFMATHGPARLVVAHEVYWLTVLMAVFSTVLPLWLMAEGMKRIGASQSSLIACIGPLATIAFAYQFLGEPVTTVQLAGAALILAGILIISLKPREVAPDPAPK
jgi:drug/metabolite transporter (DMT)-like permease